MANIMASNKLDRAAMAQELKKKIVEITDEEYHILLLRGFQRDALVRHLKDVDGWLGSIEEHMDNEYDDAIIEHLPRKFLGIPKEFAQVANNFRPKD